MRESYGSAWLFSLVLVFIFIFSSYLALTISYQRAFKVKNEVALIIEKNEGLTDRAVRIINQYLTNSGYKQVGECGNGTNNIYDTEWMGTDDLTNYSQNSFDKPAQAGKKYYYCVQKISTGNLILVDEAYYKVKLFYKFDLPVLGDIFNFEVSGETNEVPIPGDGIQGVR